MKAPQWRLLIKLYFFKNLLKIFLIILDPKNSKKFFYEIDKLWN